MSTNLEYRARETQRKRESGRHASEAQREKGRHRFGAREKKQRRHFFVGRTTRKFCNGGDKMRNALNLYIIIHSELPTVINVYG